VQSSTALVWQVATFERLVERFPTLRRDALHALEERLQEMEQRFREVTTEKVDSRLNSESKNRLGHNLNGKAEINLSRAELGQLTGTSFHGKPTLKPVAKGRDCWC
jgi:CRP/FNR family transcriptional regulator, nitrogen oxide reductase regulator